MISPNTYTQQPDRTDICTQESIEVFGDVDATAERFSMVGPNRENGFVHDVVLSNSHEGFDRIIVVDKDLFDREFYDQINDIGVQQLPLVYDGTDVVAFGVMAGMRPLTNERIHAKDSTGSYIGDKEVMFDAGQKIGRVWSRTGQLVNDPIDSMGIVSFVENDDENSTKKSPLYLCPPYNTTQIEYFDQALSSFTQDTKRALVQPRIMIPAQRMSEVADVLGEAHHGFSAGVN